MCKWAPYLVVNHVVQGAEVSLHGHVFELPVGGGVGCREIRPVWDKNRVSSQVAELHLQFGQSLLEDERVIRLEDVALVVA